MYSHLLLVSMYYNTKSMLRRLYLLVAISALSFCAKAQSQLVFFRDSLVFTNVSIDTVGQTLTAVDSLRNLGGGAFTGTVYFNGSINGGTPRLLDSAVISTALDTAPGIYKLISISLPTGDTSAHFVVGPNGVIIWPSYHAQPFADTLHIHVDISRTLGIDEAPLAKMYIIQAIGTINVQFGDARDIVKQVSFYDLSGRMIYSGTAEQAHRVAVAGWSTGIYLCQIETYRGERRTIKFMLQ